MIPGPVRTRLSKLFEEFFQSERGSGIILVFCTAASVAIANSVLGESYLGFWHTKIGFELGDVLLLKYSVQHWINDGLMAIFFLLIGLEIEREIYVGELSEPKNASLPIAAAIGGMAMPALLHFLFNRGTETVGAAGIPMATDIAFALGVLALLGPKVPITLRVFLAALAIIDDLGAIIVIAVFYVEDFSPGNFALAFATFGALVTLNRLRVLRLPLYIFGGSIMWFFMLKSGVHATIAGVLLAFAIPFGNGDEQSPSYRLQHFLHKPVLFLIMPIFCLANTGIVFSRESLHALGEPNSLGILTGLLAGKPLGIALFSLLAVKTGFSRLPAEVHWRHILGVGFLGGIGFTMSIFITMLALEEPHMIQSSKISILLSSLLAGTAGFLILNKQESRRL